MEEGGSLSGFEAQGNEAVAVQLLKLSSCVRVLTLQCGFLYSLFSDQPYVAGLATGHI